MRDIGRQITVAPNTVIFREQDAPDGAYIIERGTVEVSVTRNGRKVILGKRTAGEVFGEMSIIDDRLRTATITTLEPCTLTRITRDQIHNRIADSDPVLRMYLGVILERFRSTLEALQTLDAGALSAPSENQLVQSDAKSMVYESAISEIRLEQELTDALYNNHLELAFQPIIELPGKTLVGFESLIRWRHKERGLLFPSDFLATAEASGLIVPIGRWVFRRSCEFVSAINAQFPTRADRSRLFVSVNVSARSFSDPTFTDYIAATVDEMNVSPRDIKLEITETALLSRPEVAAEAMKKLKAFGISIAIDDFGTGYSSLSYLHKYPFDILKIDRSFVQNVHNNPRNNDFLASIMALASHLELSVIAEGIETKQQEQELSALHCGFAQGYLYSRPISGAHIVELIYRLQLATRSGVARIDGLRLDCA